jgi:hypothetical protein
MKKFTSYCLIALFLAGLNLQSIAQNSTTNCTRAITSVEYSRLLSRLKIAPNDTEKLGLAKMSIRTSCFTTKQVKEMALTFLDDNFRSEFVIEIHPKTLNNEDFYEVYDAFMYFSSVLRLHDYFKSSESNIIQNTVNQVKTDVKTVEAPAKITFPNLNYPSVFKYNGERSCEKPIDESSFMEIAQQIQSQNGKDFNQLTVASIASSSYCLSAEQTMKLSTLISNEDFRFNYLSKAYPNVFDKGNMKNAGLVLKMKVNQDKWDDFYNDQTELTAVNTQSTAIVVTCEISNDEFSAILQSINQISFESTKMNHTKNIIESKKCFTSNQIAQIMKQFSFERSMVDIAKFAYDYCIDTDNYFKLNNELTHSSSKEELIKFTQSKKK